NVLMPPRPPGARPGGLEFVPRLTDFGLARLREDAAQATASGALLGTPAYMAPEQADARRAAVGPATDVYALGVLLYEVLTPRRPFEGEAADVLNQVLTR